MRTALLILFAFVLVALAALVLWRQLDHRADRAEMRRLRSLQPESPARFSASMVANLPEPAQRFLTFAIAEGTLLATVAEIEMQGRFGLGTKSAPNYMPMTAFQILAAPHGFVWKMSGGSGVMRMAGSDSGGWTRFWLLGMIPVARVGGTEDHARSAFARYAAEAAIWTPAALLPGPGLTWQANGPDTARFTMRRGDVVQTVDIHVDAEGRPLSVTLDRWSNANPAGVFRLQPFGAVVSTVREFQGYRLPTHVEAGNFFGTDDYFPFFVVDVTEVRYPPPH